MIKKLVLDKNIGLLFLLSMLHLLFMHYFFYFNGYIEWTWLYSGVINICSVIFDVSILLILFLFITGGKMSWAFVLTHIITLIWSFVNVMYGRFFFQYMSLSVIEESHGLRDSLVVNSVMSAFYWYDVFYIVSIICFILFFKKTHFYKLDRSSIFKLLLIPIISLIITFLSYSIYHFIHPHYCNNWELYKFRAKEFLYDPVRGGTPNLAHFQIGCVRVALFEICDMFRETTLSDEQRKVISDYYLDHSQRKSNHQLNPEIKNVIFILLESFLSAPIDLKVDGKEITPFLNSLKRDSDVYYNGNMISDIGCGESGDGQFIYMTGILPLRNKMTVGQVKNNTLPSLPTFFKEYLGMSYSEIISPTVPNLWQQADMNSAYGIDNAFWREDIEKNRSTPFDDKMIFEFASRQIDVSKQPFFSLVLSLSTHGPYNKYAGPNYLVNNETLKEEYRNYLNSCHYLDDQLRGYFSVLRDNGLYDTSLIVIASDHYAHLDMLKMDKELSSHTPLFIINVNTNQTEVWTGEFHQLDVYTTLLDVLGIESKWKGLGHTLLSTSYKNSVCDSAYEISDLIIEGDFFNFVH